MSKNDHLILEIINDNDYQIKEDGTILTLIQKTGKRSIKNNWRNAGFKSSHGYIKISYKRRYLLVHRIIYAKFIGSLNSKLEINHIDGNKTNNIPFNLEQVTTSENQKHRFRVLKHPAIIGRFIINKEIADNIRESRKINNYSYSQLAKQFKVSKTTIAYIIKNKIWK